MHRGCEINRVMRYLVVFLGAIGLTVYLVRSRGWLGYVAFLAWLLLALVVWALAFTATLLLLSVPA